MRTLAILAAAIAALATAPAMAADLPAVGTHGGQVTVRLGDLDLTSEVGAQAALHRLNRAAAEACGQQPTVAPDLIRLSNAFQRCRDAALANAVSRLQSPGVTEVLAEGRAPLLRLAGR